MTTAMQHPATTAPAGRPSAVDIETRLTLAHAAMDVLLDRATGGALTEAHTAAESARTADWNPPREYRPNPILAAAGDLIRQRGWTKGAYDDATGALCAMGAIRTAARGDCWFYRDDTPAERGAVAELYQRLAAEFGSGVSVPHWNDTSTEACEVLRLLY